MQMTIHDFVEDVMVQLRPFLTNGQTVEFSLGTEAFFLHEKAETLTALVSSSADSRLKFSVTMSEAILPTQEISHEKSVRE